MGKMNNCWISCVYIRSVYDYGVNGGSVIGYHL